jgi:ubiquinone/menaquinone biosynthesis C-methylase UbiE
MHSAYTDSENLIRMLDTAESTPFASDFRVRGYTLLRRAPGAPVVDVGCGAGRAVAELGPSAVGVDPDPVMLRTARERFPGIDVREGDALSLPFADASILGYRADKVFHILPSPADALTEARRVLSPGGRIVLTGQDWDTVIIESAWPEVTRRIVHARADTITHPRIARAYRNLLLDAGFDDVTLEVHTAIFTEEAALGLLTSHVRAAEATGAVTGTEASEWLSDQSARASTGRLLVAIPMFLAAGTRGQGPPSAR